jgi:hypothetical protein
VTQLNRDDEFLLVACDGLFDIFMDDVAVEIAKGIPDPLNAATRLKDQAFVSGSTDNISVVVINLRGVFSNIEPLPSHDPVVIRGLWTPPENPVEPVQDTENPNPTEQSSPAASENPEKSAQPEVVVEQKSESNPDSGVAVEKDESKLEAETPENASAPVASPENQNVEPEQSAQNQEEKSQNAIVPEASKSGSDSSNDSEVVPEQSSVKDVPVQNQNQDKDEDPQNSNSDSELYNSDTSTGEPDDDYSDEEDEQSAGQD